MGIASHFSPIFLPFPPFRPQPANCSYIFRPDFLMIPHSPLFSTPAPTPHFLTSKEICPSISLDQCSLGVGYQTYLSQHSRRAPLHISAFQGPGPDTLGDHLQEVGSLGKMVGPMLVHDRNVDCCALC